LEELVQLISNLGFPIAMCCYLLYRMSKSDENHKAEMDNVTEALNNNTLVIQRLIDRLGEGDNLEVG